MMTLEEQERRAYADGDPVHPWLTLALDGEDGRIDKERHRADMAEADAQWARDCRDDAKTLLGGLVDAMRDGCAAEFLEEHRREIKGLL